MKILFYNNNIFRFLLYLSAQILNTPIIVVYRFGIYGYAFLLGYFVFCHESNIKHLESNYKFLCL